MLIDWTNEFDARLTRTEPEAEKQGGQSQDRLRALPMERHIISTLESRPQNEASRSKPDRQSRRYPVWRVAHPYRPGVAERLIVWFPDDQHVVVALFAGDKANMGDVFYGSVGPRADAAIDAWKTQTNYEKGIDDE